MHTKGYNCLDEYKDIIELEAEILKNKVRKLIINIEDNMYFSWI